MGNPRGGFCYPRFPGRNEIWNDVLLGGRIIGEPRGKKNGARTRSNRNPLVTPGDRLLRVPVA